MDEFELRRRLQGLASEREPARDLWPGIAAAMAEAPAARASRRRAPWLPMALAASAALLAIMLLPLPHGPISEPEAERASMQPGHGPLQHDPLESVVLREAAAMAFEYRLALAQLAPLPPELRPAARELKQSEEALREALRAQPEATWLLAQLRRNYEQRLRLSQLAALG